MGWVQLFFCDLGSSQVSVWPCSTTHAQPGALVVLQLLPSSLLAAAGAGVLGARLNGAVRVNDDHLAGLETAQHLRQAHALAAWFDRSQDGSAVHHRQYGPPAIVAKQRARGYSQHILGLP